MIISMIFKMKTHTRKYTGYNPTRIYNKLTKKQAFELELEIYKRVSGEENFPKLISYNEKNMELQIEHCGTSLNKLSKIQIENLDEQIENIVNVLEKNNIQHLDLHPSGKNLCYKDGKIYLIDYDIAVIDDKPLNKHLEMVNEDYKKIDIFSAIKSMFNGKKIIKGDANN